MIDLQQLTHNTGSFHKKEVYVMIFSHSKGDLLVRKRLVFK